MGFHATTDSMQSHKLGVKSPYTSADWLHQSVIAGLHVQTRSHGVSGRDRAYVKHTDLCMCEKDTSHHHLCSGAQYNRHHGCSTAPVLISYGARVILLPFETSLGYTPPTKSSWGSPNCYPSAANGRKSTQVMLHAMACRFISTSALSCLRLCAGRSLLWPLLECQQLSATSSCLPNARKYVGVVHGNRTA